MKVSDEFIEIYENLNCFSLRDKISKLDNKEKVLIVLAAIDNHDIDDNTVHDNITFDADLLTDLLDFLEKKECKTETIKKLSEFDEELSNIEIDYSGEKMKISNLPKPKSKSEVRQSRIDNISK